MIDVYRCGFHISDTRRRHYGEAMRAADGKREGRSLRYMNVHVLRSTLAIVLVSAPLFFAAVACAQTSYATLESFSGDVQIKQSAGEDFAGAREAMGISEGASLMTGFESEATIRFADDSKVQVRELSKVKIDKMEMKKGSVNTRLELGVGNVRANVSKRQDTTTDFEVKTPMATVSVRGTDKEIWSYSDTGTYVRCYEGVVDTANQGGQNVILTAGERTRVEGEALPELPVDLMIVDSVVNIPIEELIGDELNAVPDANGPVDTIYSILPEGEGNLLLQPEETVKVHVSWQ
jgi:hypothetical protein